MTFIYLDNNATTQLAPEVLDAMLPFFTEKWGNASSLYTFGSQLTRDIDKAREEIARLIGAKRPGEIIFTSGGTEANNSAIHAAISARPHHRHLITSSVEHRSVLEPLRSLEKKGYEVTFLPVDQIGNLDLELLSSSLREDTALVSIMWANNETGVLFPIEDIASLCEKRGVPLHVDAIQAAGKIPLDVSRIPVTFLSLSAHKLHGPKGVGALYVRRGTPYVSFVTGGTQQMGRRGGTENVAGVVGFGVACRLARECLEKNTYTSVEKLRDRLEIGIAKTLDRIQIHGKNSPRLSTTTSIGFGGVESEAVLLLLGEQGICASSGSACSAGNVDPSHVLKAMGISPPYLSGTIRLSLSRFTQETEIETALSIIPKVIGRLRGENRHFPG